MEQVQNLLDLVAERLSTVAKSDLVAGAPMVVGKVTVIPLCRISVGFGAGGGTGEGDEHSHRHQRGRGTGGTSGGGGRVRPVAVVVFTEQAVEVMPIEDRQGSLEKLLEKIPELVNHIKERHSASSESCGCAHD